MVSAALQLSLSQIAAREQAALFESLQSTGSGAADAVDEESDDDDDDVEVASAQADDVMDDADDSYSESGTESEYDENDRCVALCPVCFPACDDRAFP